jgi:hypothetical protein
VGERPGAKRGTVKWVLRAWWVLSALAAVILFVTGESKQDTILATLAVVNATAAFAGTAAVGRLDMILDRLEAGP